MLNAYAADITIEWALLICDKVAKKLIFEEVNFSIEEELEIIFIIKFDVEFRVKRYQAYVNEWKPGIGDILKTGLEPETEFSI